MTTTDERAHQRSVQAREQRFRVELDVVEALSQELVRRMGVSLSPYQQHEVESFLFGRLWGEWPGATWRRLHEEVNAQPAPAAGPPVPFGHAGATVARLANAPAGAEETGT